MAMAMAKLVELEVLPWFIMVGKAAHAVLHAIKRTAMYDMFNVIQLNLRWITSQMKMLARNVPVCRRPNLWLGSG